MHVASGWMRLTSTQNPPGSHESLARVPSHCFAAQWQSHCLNYQGPSWCGYFYLGVMSPLYHQHRSPPCKSHMSLNQIMTDLSQSESVLGKSVLLRSRPHLTMMFSWIWDVFLVSIAWPEGQIVFEGNSPGNAEGSAMADCPHSSPLLHVLQGGRRIFLWVPSTFLTPSGWMVTWQAHDYSYLEGILTNQTGCAGPRSGAATPSWWPRACSDCSRVACTAALDRVDLERNEAKEENCCSSHHWNALELSPAGAHLSVLCSHEVI